MTERLTVAAAALAFAAVAVRYAVDVFLSVWPYLLGAGVMLIAGVLASMVIRSRDQGW